MKISNSSEKVLSIFFNNPDQEFFINEIIRKTGLYPNSIQRSIITLENQGILTKTKKLRYLFYALNKKYPYLQELKNIIQKVKTGEKLPPVWVKILNRKTSYSFYEALYKANMINLKERYGIGINNLWYNNLTYGCYYIKNDFVEIGKVVSASIDNDLNFAKNDIKNCKKTCDEYVEQAKKIPTFDLAIESNRRLAERLQTFYNDYLNIFPFITIPHVIDNFFESKIKEYVKNDEDYDTLSSSTSMIDEEQKNALTLAAYLNTNGKDKTYEKLLTKHYKNYCWMPMWSINAEPLDRKYFEEEIINILNKVKDPRDEINRLKLEEKKRKKIVNNLLKKINASESLVEHVRLLQEYIYLRTYRKNAVCKANYYHLPLLFESGKRLNLTKEEVKQLSYPEIIYGLRKRISQKALKKLIKDRELGWALLLLNGRHKDVIGAKNIIETMERYQIISPGNTMQKIVRGKIACSGKATGTVKVITKLSELSKVNKGDVLVTQMTTPDYMVAIHNIVGLVTDEGSITSHAAIISREFNIPCIIATKNATQVLSDGDIVEVDANEGVVRVIENVELPEDIKVIPGRTIYKGKVKGFARVILDSSDLQDIKQGDILIAPQVTPEFLSALYRVKGFVVDEDSATSHAALYGRVLKLPSIMGTQFARHAIQSGDIVELDATRGLLKKI